MVAIGQIPRCTDTKFHRMYFKYTITTATFSVSYLWVFQGNANTIRTNIATGKTSSSAMAERPRELGDFKKAWVNGGTNNHSLKDSHKCLRCR